MRPGMEGAGAKFKATSTSKAGSYGPTLSRTGGRSQCLSLLKLTILFSNSVTHSNHLNDTLSSTPPEPLWRAFLAWVLGWRIAPWRDCSASFLIRRVIEPRTGQATINQPSSTRCRRSVPTIRELVAAIALGCERCATAAGSKRRHNPETAPGGFRPCVRNELAAPAGEDSRS